MSFSSSSNASCELNASALHVWTSASTAATSASSSSQPDTSDTSDTTEHRPTKGNVSSLLRFTVVNESYRLPDAAREERWDEVAVLAARAGIDINSADGGHWTALHWAAYYGCERACEVLLKQGALVNGGTVRSSSRGKFIGVTPLYLATEKGHVAACRVLACNNADVNVKSERMKGRTPLHVAIDVDCFELWELLVAHGADLDATDDRGRTPLHLTCFSERAYAECLFLVYQGANVNLSDNNGRFPLETAASHNNLALCRLLLEHGAEVDATTHTESTAIKNVAWFGSVAMCHLLAIEYHADITDVFTAAREAVADAGYLTSSSRFLLKVPNMRALICLASVRGVPRLGMWRADCHCRVLPEDLLRLLRGFLYAL